MISIIICSANSEMLKEVKANISETIGVPYEVISFENSQGRRSICEVYNEGARLAKYEQLCFMHEDLEFKTINWGNEINRIFAGNPEIGIIGVAGGAYKSDVPSGWGVSCLSPATLYCNFMQSFKRSDGPTKHFHSNPGTDSLAEVVCVDGMWFCTLKKIALEYPFDEALLKGFHCYDIDFCINVHQHYKAAVTFNILLRHFSEGGYDKGWFEDTLKIHDKWKEKLPLTVVSLSENEKQALQKSSYKWILQMMINMNYSLSDLLSYLARCKREGKLSNKLYLKYVYYSVKYRKQKQVERD